MTETQKKGMGKGGLIVLAVVVAILAVSNVWTYTTYQNYKSTHIHTNTEYYTLKNEKNQLRTWLKGNLSRIDFLNAQINTLTAEKNNLQNRYDALLIQYTSLARQPSPIGTALETYYDYVRANCITFGLEPVGEERWSRYPNYYSLSVSFAADLAAHDIGNAWWPTLDEGCSYYNFTGEYSYQTGSRIMEQAFALAGISSSDSSVVKIEKVLAFINSIIHYEHRMIDHMWFPCEVLTFRSGDCTSFSILTASMFEKAGIKTAIGFFTNSTMGAHAMVLVHLDNLGQYGYMYCRDLTSYGLTSGKWIIIEPQFSSLAQQESNLNMWIAYWELVAISEVPYGP